MRVGSVAYQLTAMGQRWFSARHTLQLLSEIFEQRFKVIKALRKCIAFTHKLRQGYVEYSRIGACTPCFQKQPHRSCFYTTANG